MGAGAPGENAWILKALLEHGPDPRAYIPLRDADALETAIAAGVGGEITIDVGKKLETVYNTRVAYSGQVVSIGSEEQTGALAVVRHQGIHLILSEFPAYVYSPDFFSAIGLRPCRADAVGVKNLFPFRFTFMAVNRRTIEVVTPGTTNINVFELEYARILRPIYPLDEISDWR